MSHKFINSCQADNWYFRLKGVNGTHFTRVVVWATTESGEVIGLVSVTNDSGCLTVPPPVNGTYVHVSDMSNEEKQQAAEGDRPGTKYTGT